MSEDALLPEFDEEAKRACRAQMDASDLPPAVETLLFLHGVKHGTDEWWGVRAAYRKEGDSTEIIPHTLRLGLETLKKLGEGFKHSDRLKKLICDDPERMRPEAEFLGGAASGRMRSGSSRTGFSVLDGTPVGGPPSPPPPPEELTPISELKYKVGSETFTYDEVRILSGLVKNTDLNNRAVRVCRPPRAGEVPSHKGRMLVQFLIGERRTFAKAENLLEATSERRAALCEAERESLALYEHASKGCLGVNASIGARVYSTRSEKP